MKEAKVLFIAQEITPYLPDIRSINTKKSSDTLYFPLKKKHLRLLSIKKYSFIFVVWVLFVSFAQFFQPMFNYESILNNSRIM